METQDKLVITLNQEMLEVVKQALVDYAGDKNSKDYLEVMKVIQQEKEAKQDGRKETGYYCK